MSSHLRAVIADDEEIIRVGLVEILADEPGVEVVAACRNGVAALEAILAYSPSVVFLDIQMPGLTGIEVVDNLPAADRPAVVFITAYDEFAVRAFELNAVDYLLKPFDAQRVRTMLDRVRSRLSALDGQAQLGMLLQQLGRNTPTRSGFSL